jgi:hypothetical protein
MLSSTDRGVPSGEAKSFETPEISRIVSVPPLALGPVGGVVVISVGSELTQTVK